MTELFQAMVMPHQILLTVLLGLVVFYWLLVIFGALDFESDVLDGLGDADVETSQGSSVVPAPQGLNTGGVWVTAGRFFGFSQVPIVVWLSFMILFVWFFSLVMNHWWNEEATMHRALFLLGPGVLASAVVTKVATIPIGHLFRAMADADTEAESVVGRCGTISSMEADEEHGQLEIATKGAPLLVNARTQPGGPTLKKGEAARVTAAGPDHAYYFIEPV